MARMQAADRRRQILEVSAELFGLHGYRGTTTALLASKAGITEPILYRHFHNKLDLFVTLIDEIGKEVITSWKSALKDVEDPIERLRVLLAGNPATHKRGRGIYRVIFQAMSEVDSDPGIAKALRQHISKLHRFVRDELQQLQNKKVIRQDETASELAWLLIDMAIGFGMRAPLKMSARGSSTQTYDIQKLIIELITQQ